MKIPSMKIVYFFRKATPAWGHGWAINLVPVLRLMAGYPESIPSNPAWSANGCPEFVSHHPWLGCRDQVWSCGRAGKQIAGLGLPLPTGHLWDNLALVKGEARQLPNSQESSWAEEMPSWVASVSLNLRFQARKIFRPQDCIRRMPADSSLVFRKRHHKSGKFKVAYGAGFVHTKLWEPRFAAVSYFWKVMLAFVIGLSLIQRCANCPWHFAKIHLFSTVTSQAEERHRLHLSFQVLASPKTQY
jgi:hypothetical protein